MLVACTTHMVSLDDAVVARLEKGGSRYEILVDPDLVDAWKENPSSVDLDELLAVSEVWTDSKNGERPTSDALESVNGSNDIQQCVEIILKQGSIQLTTAQRKKIQDCRESSFRCGKGTKATNSSSIYYNTSGLQDPWLILWVR